MASSTHTVAPSEAAWEIEYRRYMNLDDVIEAGTSTIQWWGVSWYYGDALPELTSIATVQSDEFP
ncbi:hypothetical protein OE88DRAFT_1668926 [Heliocybe sulcata]|uniref:Uncharacterized protein n=1 Tax=Heliocybe sulcata TaxID=5364 RepID=A0A5C3MLA3_9AGAM|nr:hypothetical protein OE88DRAFT_1668926 [Heliocybe sulcata]